MTTCRNRPAARAFRAHVADARRRARRRRRGGVPRARSTRCARARRADCCPRAQALTANAQSALARFRVDARLERLAEQEVPDARKRLTHVVKLTDEAAHRTLDLVEQSGPLVDARRAARRSCSRHGAFRVARSPWTTAIAWAERATSSCERTRGDADTRARQSFAKCCWRRATRTSPARSSAASSQLVGELETVLGDWCGLPTAEDTRACGATLPIADRRSGSAASARRCPASNSAIAVQRPGGHRRAARRSMAACT